MSPELRNALAEAFADVCDSENEMLHMIHSMLVSGSLAKGFYFICVAPRHYFLMLSGWIIADIIERAEDSLINVLGMKTFEIRS